MRYIAYISSEIKISKMKKTILLMFSTVLFGGYLFAQNVGINATGATPDAGAGLDVNFTNKGVLLPRVNIANLNAIAPIAGSTTTSLLVYNTNTTTGTGYYYGMAHDGYVFLMTTTASFGV